MNAKTEIRKLRSVYDLIADSWTNLRAHPEREVSEFVRKLNKGLVLDLGCGNCRNLVPLLKKRFPCVGMDFSRSMTRQAKRYLKKRNLRASLVIGDARNLPFKDSIFDYVICLRTLPHIPTKKLRMRTLSELKRVAKKKRKVLLSVWKRWHKTTISPILDSIFKEKFESNDAWAKWNYFGKVYKRFYHLYSKEELEEDLKRVRLTIEKVWDDERGNIWAIIK